MNESTLQIVERVEARDRLAFRQPEAAELLGISCRSLSREIKAKKIYPTKTLRVITREELVRYLREETQLSRRIKRVPRSQYKPVTSNE